MRSRSFPPEAVGADPGAVVLLARSGLRQRGRVLLGIAVVALGIGATLAALTAAWRTKHAYPEYLRRAEVGDVVVALVVATLAAPQPGRTAAKVAPANANALREP